VSGKTPAARNLLQRLAAHPGLKLAVSVIGILAGVVGIVAGILEVADRLTEPQAPRESTVPAGSEVSSPAASSPGSASGSQRSSPTEGTRSICIASNDLTVDCRESHRYEQFGGDCSIASLLDFMGGRTGLDVAFGHPTAPRGGECLLDNGRDMSSSAREALAADDEDDAWRRCYDSRRDRLVPCDEPHNGEYVATGNNGKASSDECVAAAGVYMERSIAANADLLRVQVIAKTDDDQNSPRCLISIRGTQRLGGSVRRLGANTLPVVS
jgi:hypothetical protein